MILQGHVATRQAVPNVMIPWKPNGTDSKELQAMQCPHLVSQRTAVVRAPLGGFMELIRQLRTELCPPRCVIAGATTVVTGPTR